LPPSFWRVKAPSTKASILNFDLQRALRRIDPQRAIKSRICNELDYVGEKVDVGRQLLLDTCVYIDILQGSLPQAAKSLLDARLINHSTVCLCELTHLFGRLDPDHPGTKAALEEISGVILDIPAHRLNAPSPQVCGEAGMLSGLVERARSSREDSRCALVNDATIFLQALEQGQTVLTRNLRDFSLLLTSAPSGRVLFYRT